MGSLPLSHVPKSSFLCTLRLGLHSLSWPGSVEQASVFSKSRVKADSKLCLMKKKVKNNLSFLRHFYVLQVGMLNAL